MVSQCEHCRQEKLLHEKLRFSGVEKSFCSEGKQTGRGPKALDLTAGNSGRERRPWHAGHGARGLGCSTPSILRLWAREAIQERFQMCHFGGVGSHSRGDPCVSALFPGCVLLYKQDFTKKLGLCCITCTYCSQTCQRGVTEQLDGSTWDFCSEDCKSKYLLWYCKVRGADRRERAAGSTGCCAVIRWRPISREGLQWAQPPGRGGQQGLSQGKGPSTL